MLSLDMGQIDFKLLFNFFISLSKDALNLEIDNYRTNKRALYSQSTNKKALIHLREQIGLNRVGRIRTINQGIMSPLL